MSKHTPGPWRIVHPKRVDGQLGTEIVASGDPGPWVATPSIGNERIISEAPSMLEVLRLLCVQSNRPSDRTMEYVAAADKARAILAKIDGEAEQPDTDDGKVCPHCGGLHGAHYRNCQEG